MAEVVGIRGATVIGSREPDTAVVEKLEDLLRRARDGVIHSLAYAIVCDEDLSTGWAGNADKHRVLAAVALLNYRVAKAVDEE